MPAVRSVSAANITPEIRAIRGSWHDTKMKKDKSDAAKPVRIQNIILKIVHVPVRIDKLDAGWKFAGNVWMKPQLIPKSNNCW
ncbi:MAG: hypothetical protein ACOCVT_01355 [bacterium]